MQHPDVSLFLSTLVRRGTRTMSDSIWRPVMRTGEDPLSQEFIIVQNLIPQFFTNLTNAVLIFFQRISINFKYNSNENQTNIWAALGGFRGSWSWSNLLGSQSVFKNNVCLLKTADKVWPAAGTKQWRVNGGSQLDLGNPLPKDSKGNCWSFQSSAMQPFDFPSSWPELSFALLSVFAFVWYVRGTKNGVLQTESVQTPWSCMEEFYAPSRT